MPSPFHFPRVVRSVLLPLFEATIDQDDRHGTPPTFLARDLLHDLEHALREAAVRNLDTLLDTLGIEDLTHEPLQRRLERGLEEIGVYSGGRWVYPDTERVMTMFESVFEVTWFDPVVAAPPTVTSTEPPPGADIRRYGHAELLAVGEWLAHPTLGVGRITALLPERVTVRFPDRERTLVRR